jgi:hypothetical protein
MADSIKTLVEHCRNVAPARRKHWELELSMGTHCGKFFPGITKEFATAIKAYFKLTDDKAKYYIDYYRDNVRTRDRVDQDPNKADGKLTTNEDSVVEKKKIAHIDFGVLQRNNIGLRLWLRDEIPLHPGDHGYPNTKSREKQDGCRKKMWSIDFPKDPLFRLDISEVSEFGKLDFYPIEIEVKDIEAAMNMEPKQFIESFMAVPSELLNIICNAHPQKIKYLIVPTALLKRKKGQTLITQTPVNSSPGTTTIVTNKSTLIASGALITPSNDGLDAQPNKKQKTTNEDAVDLYTPSNISPATSVNQQPTLASVSLATILASPSPLTIDTKNSTTTSTNPRLESLMASLTKSSDFTKPVLTTSATTSLSNNQTAFDIIPDRCYNAKALDFLIYSHSPGNYVLDDHDYKFSE